MFPPSPLIQLNFPPSEFEMTGGGVGEGVGLGLAARAVLLRKPNDPGSVLAPMVSAIVRRASRRLKPTGWDGEVWHMPEIR